MLSKLAARRSQQRTLSSLLRSSLFTSFPNQPVLTTVSRSLLWPHWTIMHPRRGVCWGMAAQIDKDPGTKQRAPGRGKIQCKEFSAAQPLTKPKRIDLFRVHDANFWPGPRQAVPVGTPCTLRSAESKKLGR